MISEKLGFFDTFGISKICNAKKKQTLIHSEKRPKKLHKKIQKNVIQKNVPKNIQNPEKKYQKN